MRHAARYVTALVLIFLTACGTSPLALPDAEADLGTSAVYLHGGVAFLPPVGPAIDTSGFFSGASLTIEVRAQPTGALLQTYSTAAGTVRPEDDFYLALWRVRDAVALTTAAVTTVRVSVFARDLGSAVAAEACALAAADPCLLGHFDAAIRKSRNVKTGGGVLDLTQTQTLPIKVFLQGPAFRPERLGDLVRLSDGLSFEDPSLPDHGRNCVVTEFTGVGAGFNALGAGFNALGAGFNALGAVGGMALFGSVDEASGALSSDLRLLGAAEAGRLARSLVADELLPIDAALLVVDDFGGIYELDGGLLAPAADLSAAGLTALVRDGQFSHGALVLRQVVEMVESAGFRLVAQPWGPEFQIFERGAWVDDEWIGTTDYLVIAAVDTLGFDTDIIAERIRNALNALRFYSDLSQGDGFDVGRVTINMSFTIVPCSVVDDLEAVAANFPTFESYLAGLAEENAVAEDFYAELVELLVEPLGGSSEPLLGQIAACQVQLYGGSVSSMTPSTAGESYLAPLFGIAPGYEGFIPDWRTVVEYPEEYGDDPLGGATWPCQGTSVVYVAASGNFGLDYPMYPAAWPLVVGVSSQDAVPGAGGSFSSGKSGFSNSGEVMAPGSLFELGRSSETDPERIIGYAGTSFAAPVVSLFTALDQMQRAMDCGMATYSDLIGAPDVGNLELGAATVTYCSN